MQHGAKRSGIQDEDSLPTDEELKAIRRGRMTKLSRGDSEMDGPYEQRNDSIRHLKGVLQRSPFIRAEWGNDGTRVSMLMDTGAEISLIDESVLTSVERESLGKPDVQPPQGVCGEVINFVGTLNKTVKIGGQVVRNHKFYVVRNCVVKYLVGIDFIYRLGRVTWDPSKEHLFIHETGKGVPLERMYRTTANTTLNNVCVAVVKEDVLINPGKECLVRCVAVGAQKDLEYMAEPTVSLGDEPVRPACCIVRVNNNEELWLRVINVSKVSEKLKNGETIAQLHPEFEAALPGQQVEPKGKRRVMQYQSGYYQMPLREEDAELTGFVTPDGHFQWTGRGTPFGLSGAPATFQRLMSGVLGSLNWEVALCYLDDILVWGTTWAEHLQRSRKVLQRIREVGMLLNPEKCTFGVRQIEFLGHVIGDGMLSINEARREELLRTPLPTTVTMLRKALGAFSYVQRWIPGMADLAKPLYELLDKDGRKELKWTPETRAAFERLKEQVVNPPSLYLPDFSRPFVLVTDASGVGTGAMLAQRDQLQPQGPLKPIAFFHHTLSSAERNYSTTDRELLAIVLAVKKFRVYLAGNRFDLITDHRALAWINQSLDLNNVQGRRGRWLEFLQQYPFNPVHRAGKSPELAMADYLSRVGHGEQVAALRIASLAMYQAETDSAYRLFPMLSENDIREAQRTCPAVGKYLEAREAGKNMDKPSNNEARALWQARDRLTVLADGIVRYNNYKGRSTKDSPLGKNCQLLVVLPQSLRRRYLELVHDSPLGGHMGRDRTWDRVRTMVWWPGVQSDVAKYVAGCDTCQRAKHSRKGKAPLKKTEVPDQPFQRIQIDFVGPIQASVPEGFVYVLAIQDVLTRYVKLVATLDNSAETAVQVLIDEWITQFDLPEVIGSDQGPHFTAIVFETICRELGIEHARGSPEHAQSQGQVERQNQLFANIRAVCNRNPASWPRAMHAVTFAHNTSVNRTTGVSPHELVFKQQARRPESFLLPKNPEKDDEWIPGTIEDTANAGQTRSDAKKLDETFKLVKRRISAEQDKRGRRTKTSMKRPYRIGERVRMRLTPNARNKRGGKKLADLKSEGYIVIERHGNTYKVRPEDNPNGRIKQRHYNELESAPRQILPWETDSTEDQADSSDSRDTDSEVERPRRSQRRKQPPKRLQVDGHCKRYEQHEITVTETNELSDE